jgi:hypothetical protein
VRRPEGRIALISGTARGRGRAAALRFAALPGPTPDAPAERKPRT